MVFIIILLLPFILILVVRSSTNNLGLWHFLFISYCWMLHRLFIANFYGQCTVFIQLFIKKETSLNTIFPSKQFMYFTTSREEWKQYRMWAEAFLKQFLLEIGSIKIHKFLIFLTCQILQNKQGSKKPCFYGWKENNTSVNNNRYATLGR